MGFEKGVKFNTDTEKKEAEENTKEVEFSKEEEKTQIRMNEEDIIQGLIDSAGYGEDEVKKVEIVRNGKVAFYFHIRPLSSEEYDKCRKKHTKFVRNKNMGIKMPEETDQVKYTSAVILAATTEEDRQKLWKNKRVWDALENKGYQVVTPLDVIDFTLRAGEKDRVMDEIDKISGYDSNNLEEVAKN